MTRFVLTLLCVVGCFTETNDRAPRTAEKFGEWSEPLNVGSPVNSASNDNYAVLSRDELTIYFTSDRPGSRGEDLYFATRESVGSLWDNPQNMAAINSSAADSLPFLSPNEHVLYFHSTRDGGCGLGDIWMTHRRNKHSDWELPRNLGCELNTGAVEIAPAFFEDPETEQAWLYYGSNRTPGGFGDFDVYKSLLGEDGSVGAGEFVPEFSSKARDTRIFIRKDGLEAFITTNRPGGIGLIDIWVSTRETPSDPWSVPVDLGRPVNSEFDDGSPWLSKDGTTLYFFSNNRAGGLGNRDIWYTTRVKTHDAK
jgi:hypothetical protein